MSEITFTRLKKNCKKDTTGLKKLRLAILGDCATQHLATAVRGYGVEEGFDLEVFDADYDQIDAQLLDSGSELCRFGPQFILIDMCAEKLYRAFCETDQRADFADTVYRRIRTYWELAGAHCKASILQFTFAELDDQVFGNYAAKVQTSFLYQLRKLNLLLMEGAQEKKDVFLVDLAGIQMRVGRQALYDDKLYYIAKMPVATAVLPEVARQVLQVVKAITGDIRKCVITDLDNTLWGGVIGDDGIEGIQIGELGLGHAFEELQLWLRELRLRGIILAVCSKNNEETAKEPFLHHPEMILHLDDFSMFVANWEDKVTNIRRIQETLNIGMDSIVFLDDNPFERNHVRAMIPQITVPELPEDPACYLSYLRGLDLFETASYSESDKDRTRQYQAEIERTASIQNYESYDDYLRSLDMRAKVSPFDRFQYPRIAQLTQRSNQFNLRTVRYTEAEIEEVARDPGYLTLYFTLEDCFGDHGLISVVILRKMDRDTLFLHNWLMSCRVLKRGMEEFILNEVIALARREGFCRVEGEYVPTPKNAMVKDIYGRLGFARTRENWFEADVASYVPNRTWIQRKEEKE